MCLNWVSLSFVILEFTTVEQWDGLEAQVALWYSDILQRRAALRCIRFMQWLLPSIVQVSDYLNSSKLRTLGFNTCKQIINNVCNSEHVSVEEVSRKGCETKRKGKFEIPGSSLLGCNTVSTGKRRLAGEE